MDPSYLGIIIQSTGIALLALLCGFISRSVSRPFLTCWTWAWISLAAGLWALYASFHVSTRYAWLESLYYAGEFLFGFLIVAGIRSYASGRPVDGRDRILVVPAVALAVFMPYVGPDFAERFFYQAILLAVTFVWAFAHLQRARRLRGESPGLTVMDVTLVILILNFLAYPAFMVARERFGVVIPDSYSAYNSIYDLIFELLLGFGMITLVMEDSRREVEQANRELQVARDRMEELARRDPLTASLNRHAFYSVVEDSRDGREGARPHGSVVLVDVDDLKRINDTHGHAAGDDVIRAVARSIRSVVRADDLVFRWGGDEFLVLLFGLGEDVVQERMRSLPAVLARVGIPGVPEAAGVSVSFGLASFGDDRGIERALEEADAAMYRAKQRRKEEIIAGGAARGRTA